MKVKDQLKQLNVRPSKGRGQNFIIDPNLIQKIVKFGDPKSGDSIIEIGPGLGALTEALVPFGNLTLIELQEELAQKLTLKYPELKVICQDVRSVDFSTLGSDLIVFGNLPYSLSTEIVFHLVQNRASIRRAVLMLQREFVERMCAAPGGKEYGALSVNLQIWVDLKRGDVISGNSFHPRANVESRLVELKFLKSPKYPVEDPKWFRRVVQGAFSQRRKKLVNSLKSTGVFSGADLEAKLRELEIDPGRRAETLSIEEFARMAEGLKTLLPFPGVCS